MKVFISYSHDDKTPCVELVNQLRGIDSGLLEDIWFDTSIQPGSNWDATLQKKMASSDIIVLLISSNYVGAKFCKYEAERALQLKDEGKCTVVPVLLRACVYESLGLNRIDTSPHGGPPIEDPKWPSRDAVFKQVAMEIRAVASARMGVPGRRQGFETDIEGVKGLLHSFCDRTPQGIKFDQALLSAQPHLNRPFLVVLDGQLRDSPDKYVDRLQDVILKEYFLQLSIGKLTPLEWPDKAYSEDPFQLFGKELKRSLNASPFSPVEKLNRSLSACSAVNLLTTLILERTWDANTEAVFMKYLQLWRNWPRLPRGRYLIPVIKILREGGTEVNPRIREFLDSPALISDSTLRIAILPPFEKVAWRDFLNWLDRFEVQQKLENADNARVYAEQRISFPLHIHDLAHDALPKFLGGL